MRTATRIPPRSLRRWAAAMLTLALLAGCAARAGTIRRDPNTLVALKRADAGTMNPLYAQTADDQVLQSIIYDALVTIGLNYQPQPWLAQSWTHTPDGLHWTVNLRRGVRWSDGEPFTSNDVLVTYRLMQDPKVAFNGSSDLDCIKSMTALGPYRVHFDLKYVTSRFVIATMNETILPAHIIGAIPPDRQRFSSLGERPIGTGPYMLERWQHDSELVLVRNPHFWHGPAKIPRLDYRIIFNDQAEVDALEEGSADLIDDLGFTGYKRLRKEAPQVTVQTFRSLYVETMEMNLRRPALSDVVVRQAMMYAWNRKAVTEGFTDGKTQVANTIVAAALTQWYNPHIPQYPYDPEKARSMLEGDGWKLGADGIRHKGALKLSFEMLVNQGSSIILDELEGMQADLRQVGIDVAIRQLDFASLVARTYAWNYDIIADARGGAIDPDWTSVLDSSQTPPAGANTTGYRNATVDHDLRVALRTLDDRKRHRYYDQMQLVVAQTLPMLFESTRFAALAHSARLALDPSATMQFPYLYYNVWDWKLNP